jgi:nitrogen fixation protein NifU and related proteins
VSDFSPQLVDHFTNPRNLGELEHPDARAVIKNPVCGDQIHLFARLIDDRIVESGFLAYGCAASLATASLLSEAIQNMHIDEVAQVDERRVIEWAGGYSPSQMHCAHLAKEVLGSLARNYRNGESVDVAVDGCSVSE